MKLKVGSVYEDASGDLVAIVAEHPWEFGLFIGVSRNGSVGYYLQNGQFDHTHVKICAGKGLKREHMPKPFKPVKYDPSNPLVG